MIADGHGLGMSGETSHGRQRPAGPWLGRAATVFILVVGPLLVALGLRLPPINQLEYADAWFYSAYAWVPRHHFAVFDWNYFSVRFPAILSIGVFERAFGTQAGYVVLRYLIAVVSGAAVYLGVRRFAAAPVAIAAAGLLYLNPFFSRTLLWDYSYFVAVPAGVVGLALWWWSDGRKPAWTMLAGTALAVGIFANFILATVLVILFAVESCAALRLGRTAVVYFGKRIGVAALSAILVLAAGYVSYLRFAAVTPDDLLRPTIEFLLSNEENSEMYKRPVSEWLPHELRIWAPVVLSLSLVAVLGLRVLGTDLPARIAQVCIGYSAFLWVYRFTLTSSVMETWWTYNTVIVVLAPAVGVLLSSVAASSRLARRRALLAVGISALVAVVVRTLESPAVSLYDAITDRSSVLFAIVGMSIAVALMLAIRLDVARTAALAGTILTLTFIAWAPSVLDSRGTTGVFVENADLDWDSYAAGKHFIELVRNYDSRQHRVYTWYPSPVGPEGIAWTTLPHLGTTVHVIGLPAPMNTLLPLGRARLLQSDAAYVLTMSERSQDVVDARRALDSAGFRGRIERQGTLAEGRLHYDLIRLTAKPSA